MKKIVLAVIAILICIPVFAKQRKHKKKPQSAANEIVAVTLMHTGCYGRCRIYSIEVNKNGMATYTAKRFNADSGVFTKKIGTVKAMEIINQFNTYRIDTCRDLYESRVPDVPGFAFKIAYEHKARTISDARSGPPFLTKLSIALDNLTGEQVDGSWKKTTASPEK